MMLFFEIFLIAGIIGLVIWILKPNVKEREYDKKLKESLADEYLIDPETGTKMTLEQAAAGHWIVHDNEFRTMPESEIDKLYTEEEKEAVRALNYLKESKAYLNYDLSEEDIEILEQTKMLSKYDDWSYSKVFKIEYCDGLVLLPVVKIVEGSVYLQNEYEETQLLFWVKLKSDYGHYYLREKTFAEKVFDRIVLNTDFKIEGYEVFTFKQSESIIYLNKLLKTFEGVKGIELEISSNNLFIKNLKLFCLEDIKRVEKLVRRIKA